MRQVTSEAVLVLLRWRAAVDARLAKAVAALVAVLIGASAAQAQLLPSQGAGAARAQVAMVEVVEGASAAGVIVGFDATAIYIATAAHVANLSARPRPKVAVRFDDAPDLVRPGEFLERYEAPESGDLAVVVVKRDESLGALVDSLDFAMLSPVPLPPSDSPVTSIGYSGGSAWTRGVKETLLPMERGMLRITSEATEGQSGGALYNEAWELIGMAVYRDPAGPIVYARPIASVLRSLQAWEVPVRLVARASEARVRGAEEVARENDRRAQRALRRNLSLGLARQSDLARPSNPVRSLLLAAEAINATREDAVVTGVAREALASSLSGLGGVGLGGHSDTIAAATFNGDETLLATASRDGLIRVWDLTDPRAPKCIKVLMEPGQSDFVFWKSITFDKQSKALISLAHSSSFKGGPNQASPKIWGLNTPNINPTPGWLLDDRATATAMAVSHQRDLVAVATVRDRLILYSVGQAPGKVQRTLSIPRGYEIQHLVFSRDDGVLIGGTNGAQVVIWDLRSRGVAPTAAFETGHTNRGPFKDDNRPALDLLDVSDDHTLLVTGSSQWRIQSDFGDPSLRIWRLTGLAPSGPPWVVEQTGKEASKFVRDAFFSPGSHLVIGVTPGGTVQVWDPVNGRFDGTEGNDQPLGAIQAPINRYANGAIHARDRGVLMVSHAQSVDVLRSPHLPASWSQVPLQLSGLDSSIQVMALSDTARFLLVGAIGGHARLWDLKRSDPLGPPSALTQNPYSDVKAIHLSRSGRLAITLRGTSLEFWNVQDPGRPLLLHVQDIDLKQFGDCVVCHLVLSEDERWVVVQDRQENRSRVIEIGAEPSLRRQFTVASRTWRNTDEIVFSPDGRYLFVAEENRVRVVYDLLMKSPRRDVFLESASYSRPEFSADGKWVLFKQYVNEYQEPVGRDRVVGFVSRMDALNDKTKRFPISGFATSIGQAVFSADGRWLALSGNSSFPDRQKDDRRVQVLHLVGDTWNKEAELEPIEFTARGLIFSPDGQWLFTGSSDITIGDRNVSAKIWNLREPLAANSGQRLPDVVWNLKLAAFSPDSRWLVTVSGANAYARLWALREGKLEFVSRLVGPIPHLNNHWSAVFAPDSSSVVLWTNDDATPFLWRLDGARVEEAGHAIPNGDRRISSVRISSDGRALTVLNSGSTATGTSGTAGAHVTYVDLARFPAEEGHAIIQVSAGASSHTYRQDLGLVISAGASIVVSPTDLAVAMRRSGEVAGRNFIWDEWTKARISTPYRPTFASAVVGADVIKNEATNLAQMLKSGRTEEAEELRKSLLAWARQLGDPSACNVLSSELSDLGDGTGGLEMAACALRLAPDDPDYRDTRGIAHAVLGNRKEAIADFEFFVNRARGIERFASVIPTRMNWIDRLRAGRDPFDDEAP